MRKSKRFIKKFSERFIVYIVVFVAFVNACFFMPMQVQAGVLGGAETLMKIDEIDSFGPYTYVTGQEPNWVIIPNLNWSNDSKHTFDVRFNIVGSGDSSFSSGNYFIWTGKMLFWSASNDAVAPHTYLDPTIYTNWTDHNPSPLSDVSFSAGTNSRYEYSNQFGVYQDISLAGSYHEFLGALSFEFQMSLHFWGVDPPSLSTLYFRLDTQSLHIFDTRQEYEDILEQIEHNTGETTDAVNNGFDQAMNGYDDSTGDQVSSDFESGVNDYDHVEDNLFNTSTGALQGFEFFDFGSFSAVTSGLSFCSSLLTSIYENFGGLNGIGIVISVLFSVLFMAIVIGLFRYYK